MPMYIVTQARRGPRRRRYVLINRVEDVLPGRAAFLMNLARIRAAQLARRTDEDDRTAGSTTAPKDEDVDGTRDSGTADADVDDGTPDDAASEPADGVEESPLEEWTKGELYDLARELDIAGRSKMNKSELLSAVRDHDAQAGTER